MLLCSGISLWIAFDNNKRKNVGTTENTHTYTHKSHTIYSTKTQEDPQNWTGRRK